MHATSSENEIRPGWLEVAVGLAVYLALIVVIGVSMLQMPDEQAAIRGIFGMAANGVAGGLALLAAWIVRIRNFRAFGFCAVEQKWLAAGIGLGLLAFGLSFAIEGIYFMFVTEPNTQADFQAAATAGPVSLIVLVVTGALFTPFGEEVLFRGVIANALNRYGSWAGIVGSAAIFGVVHGPSVILLDAFMVGVLTGYLFRKTNSLWPAIVVHVIYNGAHLLHYAMP